MKRIATLALSIPLLWAQSERTGERIVTAVRHWAQGDATRVAIEISSDFKFRSDQLHDPERVYFDILDAKPRIGKPTFYRTFYSESLDDNRVKRLRVAETAPGITRVVLDLAGPSEVTTTQLANPDRLMIEVRNAEVRNAPATPATQTSEPVPPVPDPPKPEPVAPTRQVKSIVAPTDLASAEMVVAEPSKNQLASSPPAKPEQASRSLAAPEAFKPQRASDDPAAKPANSSNSSPAASLADGAKGVRRDSTGSSNTPLVASAETGKAARHTASGDSSLVRELGLKISRVVIDPGHGGHDQGTHGATLIEKDLVLDVAKRVGKLIEEKMGAEVIYTRTDDTFIPLEGRTALANEKKADLFLSIHANSSPITRITGVETYYLNFADSKDAMDVAARENANAQASVFELRDVVQKITLHDKAEESKDFAGRMQSSLFALSAREFPGSRNRGVKKAPFVVLIGAQMPSILAEIGFLSNPREESLLKRNDYRQKLADALYRGVQRYADSLSHFQVAQTQNLP
jgi:N-acetylmuramoyl-L-alanine amidase